MNTGTTRESEQALLGACLLGPAMLDHVSDTVSARDFADPAMGSMYAMIQDMHAAGDPVADIGFVVRRLKATKVDGHKTATLFDTMGGNVGLASLTQSVGHACHAPQYAAEVKRASGLRRLRSLGAMIAEQTEDETADPAELAQQIDAELQGIAHQTTASKCVTLAEAAADALADIDAARSSGDAPGITTGLCCVDESIGGMYPGDLFVLAARPSIGKSAMGSQIAANVASGGDPVLFVALEMKAKDIAIRAISAETGVSVPALRASQINDEERRRAGKFVEHIGSVPFRIWFDRGATCAAIRSAAKVQQASHGLSLLVVDYLGLVRPADRRKSKWEQVSDISADLKSLALELDTPVLALCQLNRESEKEKGVPRLHHLANSGAIEQDADCVMMLHREDKQATSAILDVAKARNGATGAISLGFNPDRIRFTDGTEWSG